MRVPRVTEQQVAIAPLPNARQRLSVSADTFGAQRARRLSQGAEGLADAADGLARVAFERQAERTEAEAEEAFARWQIAATDTLAGYRSLQGGDAVGAYEAARAELDGLQARIGRELGGGSGRGSGRDGGGQGGRERGRGRAHALYAQQVANRLPAFAAGLERHRDAQSRVYRTAAMEARLQSAVAAGLADPSLGPGAELEIHALARQQGEAMGLPPETVEAIALGHISQIHLGRLEGLLAEGRGAEARVYLETYGPGITAADRLRLDTKTKAVERTAEVEALYQAIVNDGPLPASARERGAAEDEGAETDQGRGSDPGALPADPGPDGVTPQAVPAPPLSPPTTFGPRATAAEAKAAAQAELLAGGPQAAPHRLHLERMERLAEVETEDPRVLAGAADELTAAYERETATLQADKATAQAEIARSLRAGAATPASLPPDLAAVLSEEERDELEDWWRTGLRVEPDAALFEALHELFPAFPDEVSLEAPSIARHLSQEQQSLVRRRQAETRTPGAPGAAEASAAPTAGPMEGESGSVRLDDLDGTFEEAGFDSWTHGRGGGWRINRRRVSTLPDRDDPRETQVAAGLFGDDGGESRENREDETDETQFLDTVRLDAFEIDEDAAGALDRIEEELAGRTGLSEEEIEAYGRDVLKLVPGLGEVLSAQDAFEAFRTAQEALRNRDLYAALEAGALGLVELAGAAPVVGKLARLSKIGLRAAWQIARGRRFRRITATRRKQETDSGGDASDSNIERRIRSNALEGSRSIRNLPAGVVRLIGKANGIRAELEHSRQNVERIERLHWAVEDVSPANADAVSDLIHGGKLSTSRGAGKDVVNIDQSGGATEATEAFHRAIRAAGGDIRDIVPIDEDGLRWTAPDGMKFERYVSTKNGDTVIVMVPSPRAPSRDGEWSIKVRFRGQR